MIVLKVEGVIMEIYWHLLPYVATSYAYRDPYYYIIAKCLWLSYRCEVRGIVNLLELISTTGGG